MSDFFFGLDLGQSKDPTAFAIVQKLPPREPKGGALYQCRDLKRLPLDMSYPRVVAHIKTLLERPPLAGNTALILDYTGVGRPVADMFQASGLRCSSTYITVTGGDVVQQGGSWYRVPKRDLIGSAQVLLQDRRLTIAKSLPEAPTLVKELLDYRVKINVNGNDQYEPWRMTAHDDLLFSLCLATWMGARQRRVQVV